MNNNHGFSLFEDFAAADIAKLESEGSEADTDLWVRVALAALNRIRVGPISRTEANETLGLLGQTQSVATSLMCDVGNRVADSDPDIDLAEVLRQGARLPSWESHKLAKIAKQLPEMPKVQERLSTGNITPTHANALVNAAEKVGAEAAETDDNLIAAAEGMLPDSFCRYARRWADRKLTQAGLDPLQRQRRAREAKMWIEKETGLGVLMAKFPRPQFEQLRQAIDNRYMHLQRQDGNGSLDPEVDPLRWTL